MQYFEALKIVGVDKPQQNYMCVTISYNQKLLFDHAAGVAFLKSLSHVEHMTTQYNQPPSFGCTDSDFLKVEMLSAEQYRNYKIAALMNITVDAVKEAALEAKNAKSKSDPVP